MTYSLARRLSSGMIGYSRKTSVCPKLAPQYTHVNRPVPILPVRHRRPVAAHNTPAGASRQPMCSRPMAGRRVMGGWWRTADRRSTVRPSVIARSRVQILDLAKTLPYDRRRIENQPTFGPQRYPKSAASQVTEGWLNMETTTIR